MVPFLAAEDAKSLAANLELKINTVPTLIKAVLLLAFSRLRESWISEVLRFRKVSNDSSEFKILIVS